MSNIKKYHPPEIKAVEGDVSPYLNLIQLMFPDPADAKIVHDFFAFNIQNPGEKMSWCLAIQGGQGIGKTIIGDILRTCIGTENVIPPGTDLIHEKFNSWAKDKCLAILEPDGMNKFEFFQKFKPLITNPKIAIQVDSKDQEFIENTINVLVITNRKITLITENNDRRLYVIHSPLERLKFPGIQAVFDNFFDWLYDGKTYGRVVLSQLKTGPIEHIYHYYLNYKIKDFNPFKDTLENSATNK